MADFLRALIVEEKLKSGDKLHTARELAIKLIAKVKADGMDKDSIANILQRYQMKEKHG